MTRRPVCSDAWSGAHKCSRDPGHAGAHSDGVRFWDSRNEPEPFVAEWIRRSREHRLPAKELAR